MYVLVFVHTLCISVETVQPEGRQAILHEIQALAAHDSVRTVVDIRVQTRHNQG